VTTVSCLACITTLLGELDAIDSPLSHPTHHPPRRQDPVVTPCHHWFCLECIEGVLSAAAHQCPLCRQRLEHRKLRRGVTQETADAMREEEEAARAAAAAGGAGGGKAARRRGAEGGVVCDSKLKVLLEELRAMRAKDPTSKVRRLLNRRLCCCL
jgi:hypothetical protein